MNRSRITLLHLYLCLFGWLSGALEAEPIKLNVVFIAVDDLRPQLGCYGDSWMKTPNIDRLAASACVFKRHYVQVATCGASRRALLTGLRPALEGDYGNGPFRSNKESLASRTAESFPHLFRQQGYTTMAVGKISHSNVSSLQDLPRSWTGVRELERLWGPRHNFVNAYAQVERPASIPPARNKGYAFESPDVGDKGYPDGWIAEHAVQLLNELKDEPFLLAVGFMKPHLPFNAPKKYWDLYDPATFPPIENPAKPSGIEVGMSLNASFELLGQYDVPDGGLDDPAYVRQLRHGYSAAISYVDAQIGKVLDELDRLGLRDNTIVVLWGDHGWHLGELGSWGKHTAFEYALRSPLMIRVPGMSYPEGFTEAIVESVDIYPTLAELFGLPVSESLEGDSFVNVLKSPDAVGSEEAFGYHRPWAYEDNPYESGPWAKTVRTDRYRFTRWTTGIDSGDVVQDELYDHRTDPGERSNIADLNPVLVKAMVERLERDDRTFFKDGVR